MSVNMLMVAGEPSGDALGGTLAEELKRLVPDINMWGFGGSQMDSAGVEILTGVDELSVMGFVEVIGHIPEMFRRMTKLADEAVDRDTCGAVLIDYPGFNLRLADRLSNRGIPVIYYVSPQIWAWKASRINRIKRSVKKMMVILPFEEDIYHDAGVPVSFVGHPFVDSVVSEGNSTRFLDEFNLHHPLLLLLPGSRLQEVKRLLPRMIDAYRKLRSRDAELDCVIVRSPNIPESLYRDIAPAKVITGRSIEAMFTADAAICCSGSATLQCAVAGLPHVITYKAGFLSGLIYRSMIKTEFVGLSNLVACREVAPELLQRNATAAKLARAVSPMIYDSGVRGDIMKNLSRIREKLGEKGVSRRLAIEVIEGFGL